MVVRERGRRNFALGEAGVLPIVCPIVDSSVYAGTGIFAGVLLGGILTSGLSWRWVLFGNVPIGITAALLAPRFLPESRAQPGARTFASPAP